MFRDGANASILEEASGASNLVEGVTRSTPLFEVIQQKIGDFLASVDQEVRQAASNGEITFVYQRGIGFVDGDNPKTRFVETSNFGGEAPMFGTCVVVAGWCPRTREAFLLHADGMTDLEKARGMVEERFGEKEIELSVIGGQTGNSEGTLETILDQFGNTPKWTLRRIDILGPPEFHRQVVVDAQTGNIYDLSNYFRVNLKPWSYDPPANIKRRIMSASSMDRSIVLDMDFVPGSSAERLVE